MELKPGDTAPAFSLPDENGKTVSSESLKGKTYFLYFYPKDDTPGCTTEACQLNDNLAQFRSLGVPVIGISQDDANSHQAFQKKYGLRFDLLTDADRSVHKAYGAWGDRPGRGEGVIRSSFLVGPDGKITKAWYAVKPDGHAVEVLRALTA
ncbi:MAG TPA: peroxiredoxin [Candidatus Limnocylindria bacterium]|nr:peroxiredoxin [Candidatus Limnocylindria bacterium]